MRDSDWPYWLLQTVAPFLFIFLWSTAYIAVRASLPDVSPLFFLTIRFGFLSPRRGEQPCPKLTPSIRRYCRQAQLRLTCVFGPARWSKTGSRSESHVAFHLSALLRSNSDHLFASVGQKPGTMENTNGHKAVLGLGIGRAQSIGLRWSGFEGWTPSVAPCRLAGANNPKSRSNHGSDTWSSRSLCASAGRAARLKLDRRPTILGQPRTQGAVCS